MWFRADTQRASRETDRVGTMNWPVAFFASPFKPEYRWVRNAVAKAARELQVELRTGGALQ
jgi:hypothetical protein